MGTDRSWSNTDVHEAPTPTHHLGLVAHGNTCSLEGNAICYMEQSNCTKTINCQNDTRCLFDNSQKCELTSSSIHTSLGPYLIWYISMPVALTGLFWIMLYRVYETSCSVFVICPLWIFSEKASYLRAWKIGDCYASHVWGSTRH